MTGIALAPTSGEASASAGNAPAAVSGNAGNPAPNATPGAGNGTQPGNASGGFDALLAGLAPENREYITKKGWKSVDDQVKSYRELETAYSSRQPASVPAKPEEYTFDVKGEAKALGWDDTAKSKMQQWSHKHKLSPEQANGILNDFLTDQAGAVSARSQQSTETVTQTLEKAQADLTKAWGTTDSPQFKQNLEMARRAIKQLGLGDELAKVGVIQKVGDDSKIANAAVLLALAKVGESMYGEDALFGDPTQGANPFDPKTENLTAQGQLWKADQSRAVSMIMALPEAQRDRYQFLLDEAKAGRK